jgi:hypothetical protein
MSYFLNSGIMLKGAQDGFVLEFGKPGKQLGIKNARGYTPKVLILMSYIPHRGAYVKHDVYDSYPFDSSMTKMAGDHKLIDLLVEHARNVED